MLLSNGSTTGGWIEWAGGTGIMTVAGTFGGSTITLEMLGPDGSTALTVGDDTTFTTAGAAGFILPACRVRAAVSGGGASGLYAEAHRLT